MTLCWHFSEKSNPFGREIGPKIRRLVDANVLGIATCNVDVAVLTSNEAFLRMVHYDHEDVARGPGEGQEQEDPGNHGQDANDWEQQFMGAFQHASIPHEEYGRYPFLTA